MRRLLAPALAAALAVALPTGCGIIATTAEHLGDAVKKYCTEPEAARHALRSLVNDEAKPHAVRIDCAGDTT